MLPQETPVGQPARGATTSETPPAEHMPALEPPRSIDIPPAFYRDDAVPPPPPDDPHWREWPQHDGPDPSHDGPEPIPRGILIGLPVALGALGVLHILVILLVLHCSGLY